MMPVEALQDSLHLRHVLQASIQAFDSDEESCMSSQISSPTTGCSQTRHIVEEGIEMLRTLLPDTMIIAALDIIDREGGE